MMKTLSDGEQKTFEQLVSLTQPALKKVMSKFVRKKYGNKNVIETADYICVQGEIPIALVAHMDTVFEKPVKDLFYDQKKNVMWSPQGIGADDRAGVYAIIRIINSGLKPHIILTTDEESGCLGAAELAKLDCPFKELQYCIQLDRRGTNDCVFYDCDNSEFVEYVEQFGFTETYGSFSDICEICSEWGVAGVNLSVGYVDEHSLQELFYISPFLSTIEKVKKMLQQEDIPFFKYIPNPYAFNWSAWKKGKGYYYGKSYDLDDGAAVPSESCEKDFELAIHMCFSCGKDFWEEEMFPVKMKDNTIGWVCTDCCVDKVAWCDICNEPYENDEKDIIFNECPDCRKIKKACEEGAV